MTSARLFTCCCSRDRPSPTTRMRASSSSSLLLLLAAAAVGVLLQARPSECARAFFVFGDSLVDNGNNNYLMTTARADSPPYGIDYPTHRPTGRFSNGKNIPDIISTYEYERRYSWYGMVCMWCCILTSNDNGPPTHLQASTSAPSPRCRT
jgi:hypothetical protein